MKRVACLFCCLLLSTAALAQARPSEQALEAVRTAQVFYDESESGAPIVVFEAGSPDGVAEALEYTLQHGRLDPRVYYYSKPSGPYSHSRKVESLYKMSDFAVTEEHLALLRHLSVRDREIDEDTGRLTVLFDSKRPYGDFTYYQAEMALHLGLPTAKNDRGEVIISRREEERMTELHEAMQIVLAIFLTEYRLTD